MTQTPQLVPSYFVCVAPEHVHVFNIPQFLPADCDFEPPKLVFFCACGRAFQERGKR